MTRVTVDVDGWRATVEQTAPGKLVVEVDRPPPAGVVTALCAGYGIEGEGTEEELHEAMRAVGRSAIAQARDRLRCRRWSGSASGYPWRCTFDAGHEGVCSDPPPGHHVGPPDKL